MHETLNKSLAVQGSTTTYLVFLPLSAVDCGALLSPTNGQVNHTAGTTLGTTATYSCNTGYSLQGSNSRTCQATGMWSGSPPTCQRMLLCMCKTWLSVLGDPTLLMRIVPLVAVIELVVITIS